MSGGSPASSSFRRKERSSGVVFFSWCNLLVLPQAIDLPSGDQPTPHTVRPLPTSFWTTEPSSVFQMYVSWSSPPEEMASLPSAENLPSITVLVCLSNSTLG